MILVKRSLLVLIIGLFIFVTALEASTVEKWRRHVISLKNETYSGNPFELDMNATFFHAASGTKIKMPGYYAGRNTWKVGFMPTLTGAWSYTTASYDPDLHGITGFLTCVQSGLPGMLKQDENKIRKWKFTDGPYVVPMAFRMEFFFEPAGEAQFVKAADFLKHEVRGHMLETRLLDEKCWFDGRSDYIFKGDWKNHEFDLAVWNRMEKRMEILTERGLGAHVMFYSDDAGEPGWAGQSPTEKLVIRYVVARLAGYPVVWFNTGIDIAEYRSKADIDWFGALFQALDPYDHPISSRHGGGSGGHVMDGQLFDSEGYNTAQIDEMTSYFLKAETPVSMDDAWGENRGSHSYKDHTEHDIRRAFWKCLMAGGTGGLVRGGGDGLPSTGYFSIKLFKRDLESEQWLRLINPYIQFRLGKSFRTMVPEPSMVTGAYCLANAARTRLLYFTPGAHDRYDPNGGGPFTVRLSGLSGQYFLVWFDPRSGHEFFGGVLPGGQDHPVAPPTNDDWVLFLITF